jgi:hypothetical protein
MQGTVLAKFCPAMEIPQNVIIWYLRICIFQKLFVLRIMNNDDNFWKMHTYICNGSSSDVAQVNGCFLDVRHRTKIKFAKDIRLRGKKIINNNTCKIYMHEIKQT